MGSVVFSECLETERLQFRRPRVSDAESIYERWTSRLEPTRFMLWPTHTSVDETKQFLDGCVAAWEDDTRRFPWVLESREGDDAAVGMVEVNVDEPTVQLGYIVAPDEWGNGYAPEASERVISEAFDLSDIWRVAAIVDAENEASIRVLEKVGMEREGRLRRLRFRPNLPGETPRDTYVYATVQ